MNSDINRQNGQTGQNSTDKKFQTEGKDKLHEGVNAQSTRQGTGSNYSGADQSR